MEKKKPEGGLWEEFVRCWHDTDHAGKLKLCEMFKVSYDVGRHWVSDSGEARVRVEPTQTSVLTLPELMGTRPATQLDFVCFDIETSNLTADFSVTLTACIKPFGQPPMVFRADRYPTWSTARANDKALIVDISNELRRHAVIITHYGTGFDIPFLRAKMVKHGLEPLPPMFSLDSYHIAKQNFKVGSRRLKNLAEYFDIGDKSGVEGGLWMKAAYDGDIKAMDEIVAHNIADVEILERLACLSFAYVRSIKRL